VLATTRRPPRSNTIVRIAIGRLVSNMFFNTPTVEVATLAKAAGIAAPPAAPFVAALSVARITGGGTHACAVAAGQAQAMSSAAEPNPRCINRWRNTARPRSNRLFSVPFDKPSNTAASSWVLPRR
jgi:hypothetical protein